MILGTQPTSSSTCQDEWGTVLRSWNALIGAILEDKAFILTGKVNAWKSSWPILLRLPLSQNPGIRAKRLLLSRFQARHYPLVIAMCFFGCVTRRGSPFYAALSLTQSRDWILFPVIRRAYRLELHRAERVFPPTRFLLISKACY